MPAITALDIPLNGIPVWVVGLSIDPNTFVWMISLENGAIQYFQTEGITYQEIELEPRNPISQGSPIAISQTNGEIRFLNDLFDDLANYSHPIPINAADLAYIAQTGDLIIQSQSNSIQLL